MLLNYNGMLRDLFTLLTESKARIQANVQAIEARRDFWLAQVDLHVAVVGGGAMAGAGASVSSGASPEAGGH
jgi:outer membrane protein TolC